MRTCVIIGLLFWICFLKLSAQTSAQLSSADRDLVDELVLMANENAIDDMDSSFLLADSARRLAERIDYPEGKAAALDQLGFRMDNQGEYAEAVEIYKKSLKLKLAISDTTADWTYGEIGFCLQRLGKIDEAVSYHKKAIAFAEAHNHQWHIGLETFRIGFIYYEKSDRGKAWDYFESTLAIGREIEDDFLISLALEYMAAIRISTEEYDKALELCEQLMETCIRSGDTRSIGSAYLTPASIYFKKGDFKEARRLNEKALEVFQSISNKPGMARAKTALGNIALENQQTEEAIGYFSASYQLELEMQVPSEQAHSLVNLGSAYLQKGNYPKVVELAGQALQLAKASKNASAVQQSTELLWKAHKALNHTAQALEYYEQFNAISDSISEEDFQKALIQKDLRHQNIQDSLARDAEKQEMAVAHQKEIRKKNSTRNIVLGSGLLVLLLAGGLWSRLRYISRTKKVIESERDRSDNLLLNILPSEIAEELKEKGRADARDFDQVSILFTDFKSFTQASAQLSAQELVSEINVCFEAFDRIIEKYSIEKIKTIGDAYMAVGGLPVPTEDSVKNTVLAALAMQDFILKRKAESLQNGKLAFEMRLGIHTGPVVAGIVGIKKFQYDIWGDTVNTASRMESHGEVGKVNISQDTYELLKDDADFSFESRGKIAAKGKGEIEMWFVK